MADLRISQLTEVTSLDTADVLPVVDANVTKKVTIANLNSSLPVTTFVQNASGNWGGSPSYIQGFFRPPYSTSPPTDNLPNGTDTYIRLNDSVTNDSSTFELVNSNTTNSRIQIKKTGLYEFIFQAVYFDLWNDVVFAGHLDSNTLSTGGSWSRVFTLFRHFFAADSNIGGGQIITGQALVNVTTANLYWNAALFASANTPFPAGINNTVTNLLIRRVGI